MCGIAGAVGLSSDSCIKAMTRALAHRGPDDEGYYVRQTPDGVVALGHRRLSIIDLEGGAQPIASEDGRVVAVVNGEIYGHTATRQDLERRGHRFATRSDSEVVVHLYEEYGLGLFDHLDGMYAFALWDGARRELVLGRDRIGKKPLYWRAGSDWLVFASEPKALAASGFLPDRIDAAALQRYLRFGYVPAPGSFYQGLESLPAGSFLTWQAGRVRRGVHFRLDDAIDREAARLGVGEAAVRARTLIEQAVCKRLEADVPIGVFLSGGVDSTVVAALAARHSKRRIATFTVAHDDRDASYDESAAARAMARTLGTDHHEIRLAPDPEDWLARMIDRFDEPFADSSAIANDWIAEATAREVKVVLSGVGGDEAFGGYPRHQGLYWSLVADRIPARARRFAARRLAPRIRESQDAFNHGGRLRRFLEAATLDPHARYLRWVSIFDAAARAELLRHGGAAEAGAASPLAASIVRADAAGLAEAGHAPLDFAWRHDAGAYLPEDLLRMIDRTSMAHGLEVRAPLCDPALVGFALGLRPDVKLRFGTELKSVLKRATRDLLPSRTRRAPKRGFMVPVARWMRHELREAADALLSRRACDELGLLRGEPVARLWHEHRAGRANHAPQLFALLALQAWRLRHPRLEVAS